MESCRSIRLNAADIIHEIETLPEEEKDKVIDFVRHLAQQKFEEERIHIAAQRLDGYDKGFEEGVPYEEARRLIEQEDSWTSPTFVEPSPTNASKRPSVRS